MSSDKLNEVINSINFCYIISGYVCFVSCLAQDDTPFPSCVMFRMAFPKPFLLIVPLLGKTEFGYSDAKDLVFLQFPLDLFEVAFFPTVFQTGLSDI